MVQELINITFMKEKVEGRGEDAPPFSICKNNAFAIGVFDGMGGSGASICRSKYGDNHTMAYVASRIVCDVVCELLDKHLGKEELSADRMEQVIKHRLRQEKEDFPPVTQSALRSKLICAYPTTMAIATLQEKDNKWCIDSFWAGDSRCYLWKKEGFYQITKDDLEEVNDPMKNLSNDSAMSNCICADKDFHINHQQIAVPKEEPVIILSTTDGCFGYYSTPMDFEEMLKDCLRKAKNEDDWKTKIWQCIQEVTGDDTSFALIGIGCKAFEQYKSAFSKPVKGFDKIKKRKKKVDEMKKQYEMECRKYEQSIQSYWEQYKKEYMRYLNEG